MRSKRAAGRPPVLLIDEIDRADEEFEGYLLELLSDFQVTIPELGTIRAHTPPVVIITSNRTREVHDALKRRCLYHWIDYPDFDKELRIVLAKVPGAPERLAAQVTAFVQELRGLELYKAAGVSETLDWVAALVALNRETLTPAVVEQTLGVLLKNQDDIDAVRGERLTRSSIARWRECESRGDQGDQERQQGDQGDQGDKPMEARSSTTCSSSDICSGAVASKGRRDACRMRFARSS